MKRILAMVMAIGVLATLPAWAAGDESLSVEIHKGQRVRLPAAAASVVVANPDVADVQVISPRTLYIYGKAIGETSVYVSDADENTVFNATVDVTHDIESLEQAVKRAVPNADVTFRTVNGGLLMEGNAPTVADAENVRAIAQTFLTDATKEKIVNMIKTAGSDQVMLKVKFVEMSRSDLKNLGVNLQNLSNTPNKSFQLLQGRNLLYFPDNINQTPDTLATPGSILDRGSSTNSNLMLRYRSLTGVLDALETQGLANVLAEPTLVTTSGKAASFLAGGQFPVPVVQSSTGGAPVTSIQYQPFGVSLKFTPIVMSHDRISLTVNPEVSTLDFNNPIQVSGITYPILDTRQASAVVELGSGDSFMLAGMLQNETTDTIKKFPGLGDLPILGALFRSTSFENNETDLVILVTPYIVHPVADTAKMQTPLTGYRPPSDLQLLMEGNLYRQQPLNRINENAPRPAQSPIPAAKLNGAGGFIME